MFSLLLIIFGVFGISNLEIQKVQNLGFIGGRLYQKRLLDTVIANDNYDKDAEYISLNFACEFASKYNQNKGELW